MISDGNNLVMPVGPMYGVGNGGNCGFGGDWSSWILLFLIAMMFGNNGWGNNGGNGGNSQFPWLLASGQRTDDNVQAGFNQAATAGQLSSIQSSINTGFANAEVANCNRAINQLQADYNGQIAMINGMNNINTGLLNCCCENRQSIADLKATMLQEGCADRNAIQMALRDVLTAQNAGIQSLKDQLCQYKIDAKDDEIARLRQEVAMKDLAASQTAQNAFIQQGFSSEVDQLYNRLNSCPVPTTPVYGRTPIFTCQNQNPVCGYGCPGNAGFVA